MIYRNETNPSVPQKTLFSLLTLGSLLAGLYTLFPEPKDVTWLPDRSQLMAVFLVVYYARLLVTVWVFQKRRWTWLETAIISTVIPIVVFAFARVAGEHAGPLDWIDAIGILLYVAGSVINTHAEGTRYVWKLKAENRDRIYTEGLFGLARHINFLGDVFLFIGLAMVTHSPSMLAIPLFMTVNFIGFIIPRLDRYLAAKYGDQFTEYAGRTRKLIPFVY